MDAKILQIGDLVYNTYHCKVIRWNYGEMFTPNHTPVLGTDLEPIPITEDILKDNGFVDKGNIIVFDRSEGHLENYVANYVQMHKWGMDGEHKVFLCSILWSNVVRYNNEIKYVHDLQHALRACGLDDLADNFKIE